MSRTADSNPPIVISERTPIRMPLGVLVTLIGVCAVTFGSIVSLKGDVSRMQAQISEMRIQQAQDHEILARLDASLHTAKLLVRAEQKNQVAVLPR